MHSKKINLGSRDLISGLPDCLICHILSFVPTKESASTSVLARRWRYLFALTPNLHFDDSVYLNPQKGSQNRKTCSLISGKRNKTPVGFVDFVDSVLVFHGNASLNRFSLKCEDFLHSAIFIGWILKVLDRGVLDLDLQVSTELVCDPLPSEMFVNKTLVRLKIGIRDFFTIDVKDVFLPKVKTLCLEYVTFRTPMLMKLLSGCEVLEELVLNNLMLEFRGSYSVFNRTLKRLTFRSRTFDGNHKRVSFVTPNLVYLEYADTIADKYPRLCLSSLVEARLGLRMTSDDRSAPEKRAGNATDFLMCICNVRILYLSHDTLEALTYCSKPIPKFNNLIHLTIKTDTYGAWGSLVALLKNCPNLKILVFEEGLHQKFIPTCISSSPVKVIKITFGRIDDKIALEQVKHFLQTMPNLEEMIIYYKTCIDEHVSTQLLQMLTKVASPKCQVQLISW